MNKEEYNNIPVFFCKKCLSLRIMTIEGETDFCDNCGSTDIDEIHIEQWETKYKSKYNKPFIKNYGKKNGRD